MSRRVREESKTGYYHVMQRGAGKQILFEDNTDYQRYVDKTIVYDKEYYNENVFGDISCKHILIAPETNDNMSSNEKKEADKKALNEAKDIIKQLNEGADFCGFVPIKIGPSGKILEMELVFAKWKLTPQDVTWGVFSCLYIMKEIINFKNFFGLKSFTREDLEAFLIYVINFLLKTYWHDTVFII